MNLRETFANIFIDPDCGVCLLHRVSVWEGFGRSSTAGGWGWSSASSRRAPH